MKKVLGIIIVGLATCSCIQVDSSSVETGEEKEVIVETVVDSEDETAFIHTVFFWMNDSLTEDQMISFETAMANLLNIESIYKGYYGPPAMTPREVVDNSYDFAFVVHFKSKEDHDLYQQDSLHLKLIADYKTYWDSIKIYDNLVTESKTNF